MPPEANGRDRPLVSVILPTYNRPHLLRRAIASVLEQTYQHFELIVVDDCSADDTRAVVESFRDTHIRFVRHERNKGNAATRNTGIRLARGSYIAFLDDDDEWLPKKLAVQVPMLAQSSDEVALVYSGHRIISDGEVIRTEIPTKEGNVFDDILPRGLIPCPTVLLKAQVLDEVGLFDESLNRGVDSDLWRRIACIYEVLCVRDVLVNVYVDHAERVTPLDSPKSIRDDIAAGEAKLRKFKLELETRPTIHSMIVRKIGLGYIKLGNPAKGRRYLLKAVRLDPRRLGIYLDLLASFMGTDGLAYSLRLKQSAQLVTQRLRGTVDRIARRAVLL